MKDSKSVGLITIHDIDNFGSLLQAFATQSVVEKLGYNCEIINYKYPNEYHIQCDRLSPPYACVKPKFWQRVRLFFYYRLAAKGIDRKKHLLFEKEKKRLLKLTAIYESRESLFDNPPQFDIYLTGSDQVWNPRYLYEDTSFFLPFVNTSNKIAYSASFGSTDLPVSYQKLIRPLLNQYRCISTRENSGVRMVKEICGKDAICTCDPTLLLTSSEWASFFDEAPLIKGNYILCYILTYTANPYPYAYHFIKHIKKALGMKVVFIDEGGYYWGDFLNKSLHVYGPNDIINLFRYSSFIISSSFHGAAFSINFRKDFYSIFPKGVKDERQESLLRIVGAENRLVRVGDPLPASQDIHINNWDTIERLLNKYVSVSYNYLKDSLSKCEI